MRSSPQLSEVTRSDAHRCTTPELRQNTPGVLLS